jgi:hypothetical protein
MTVLITSYYLPSVIKKIKSALPVSKSGIFEDFIGQIAKKAR